MSLMYPSEFIGGKREDGYQGVPVHSRRVGQTGINEGRFLHGQLIFSILRVFKYITGCLINRNGTCTGCWIRGLICMLR